MRYHGLIALLVLSLGTAIAGSTHKAMDPKDYVGNVFGMVSDAASGLPIVGAQVEVFSLSRDMGVKGTNVTATQSNDASFRGEPPAKGYYRVTDGSGKFVINYIPAPNVGKSYDVRVSASGYESRILRGLFIPPGASCAPHVVFQLRRGLGTIVELNPEDMKEWINYGSQSQRKTDGVGGNKNTQSSSLDKRPQGIRPSMFATDEGLVGGTTANGHVITEADHFCALPDRSVLNADDQTTTYSVDLKNGSTTVHTVPVWDIGPWNIHDDYWNAEASRSIYSYLNQGGTAGLGQYMSEAEQAYYFGYNGGKSEPIPGHPNGYSISNPSSIDLADGTFSDIGLSGNGFIQVTYNWQSVNSTVAEDVKQTEYWFSGVAVTATSSGGLTIHIAGNSIVEAVSGCTLT
jgi:hypothetical protein